MEKKKLDKNENNNLIEKNNKKKHFRKMTKYEYKILWTIAWLLFIFGLCNIFKDFECVWLLMIWGIGMI